jgi:hypothetical protein
VEIVLPPSVAARIREVLGEDTDLSPSQVPGALARLAVESPTVYSAILAELSGSRIRLDSERELLKRRRHSLIRRVVFWWAEHETDVGDRVLAKRAIAAAVPFGLAGVLVLGVALSGLFGHRPPRPHALRVPTTGARPWSPIRPAPQTDLRPSRQLPAPGRARDLLLARPRARGVNPGLPFRVPEVPLPPVPTPTSPIPAAPRENPVVYTRNAAGTDVDRAGPSSPIVFSRAQEPGADASPAVPGEGPSALLRGAVGGEGTGPAGPGPRSPRGGWTVGQRVSARLVTGAVGIGGNISSPVIAEGPDPGVFWLGNATLGPGGVLQIAFTLASSPRDAPVRGIALDPDRLTPGLPGRTVWRRPHVAAEVLASAAQAATTYLQDLARQGQLTIGDGWARVAVGQAAPPWAYLAAQLARQLDLQVRATSPVETVELAPHTPLLIVVTEVP